MLLIIVLDLMLLISDCYKVWILVCVGKVRILGFEVCGVMLVWVDFYFSLGKV